MHYGIDSMLHIASVQGKKFLSFIVADEAPCVRLPQVRVLSVKTKRLLDAFVATQKSVTVRVAQGSVYHVSSYDILAKHFQKHFTDSTVINFTRYHFLLRSQGLSHFHPVL